MAKDNDLTAQPQLSFGLLPCSGCPDGFISAYSRLFRWYA